MPYQQRSPGLHPDVHRRLRRSPHSRRRDKLDDPAAPVWSAVHLSNAEALGGGTIAYDPENGKILPHIHVSVGLKERSATGHTSHLLDATIQFLTEMIIVEVTSPDMLRLPRAELYQVPLLQFGR